MGLPTGWTCSTRPANAPALVPRQGRLRAASLFAGIGGLDLGITAAMETKIYVEKDEACKRVLQRRIADRQLDAGKIISNIEDMVPADVESIEAVVAGFPCPDIAISGKKRGLSAERSSLFRFVVKAAAWSKCGTIVLENVANILSDTMRSVFFEVIAYLWCLGFCDLRWGVLTASSVGSPQCRKRWFLVGFRSQEDRQRFQDLMPALEADDVKGIATKPWNQQNTVALKDWLVPRMPQSEKERLLQLGHAVVPQCAQAAVSLLTHMPVEPKVPSSTAAPCSST